jgi:hypothetical protein
MPKRRATSAVLGAVVLVSTLCVVPAEAAFGTGPATTSVAAAVKVQKWGPFPVLRWCEDERLNYYYAGHEVSKGCFKNPSWGPGYWFWYKG